MKNKKEEKGKQVCEIFTTNHEEIKTWAEKHNGKPAMIMVPEADDEAEGIRIDFPGESDEVLLSEARPSVEIDWEKFFAIFEKKRLLFVYKNNDENIDDITYAYRFANRAEIK